MIWDHKHGLSGAPPVIAYHERSEQEEAKEEAA
jgi:hypothetical protein